MDNNILRSAGYPVVNNSEDLNNFFKVFEEMQMHQGMFLTQCDNIIRSYMDDEFHAIIDLCRTAYNAMDKRAFVPLHDPNFSLIMSYYTQQPQIIDILNRSFLAVNGKIQAYMNIQMGIYLGLFNGLSYHKDLFVNYIDKLLMGWKQYVLFCLYFSITVAIVENVWPLRLVIPRGFSQMWQDIPMPNVFFNY